MVLTAANPMLDHCVSDDPEAPYPVPGLPAFIDANGKLRAYAPAADLADLADRLFERHDGSLYAASSLRIAYSWKAAGGAKSGNAVLGACKKLSDTEKFVAYHAAGDGAKPPEILIWLAADHLRGATAYTVEACLFHELLHSGRTKKAAPTVLPHDCEMFGAEVRVYGLWRDALREADDAFRQMAMAVEA